MTLRSYLGQPSRVIETLGKPEPVAELTVGAPAPGAPAPPPIGQADGRNLLPGIVLDQVGPLPAVLRAGDEVAAVVRWRAGRPVPPLVLQLVQGGRVIAEREAAAIAGPAAGGERWLRQRLSLRVPADARDGEAQLAVAPLERSAGEGALALGALRLQARDRQMAPQPMAVQQTARFGDAIELAGWAIEPGCTDADRTIAATFQWHALQEMATAYTVFVHILAPDGTNVGQRDSQPRRATYPTTAWVAGEYVVDRMEITLLPAARPVPVRVIAGWYDLQTLQRLPTTPAHEAHYVVLGESVPGCP
jgi:hypothetical protein